VRWVVGFPPGGTSDIVARLIGQWLSERLGQQFVIENRPGANSNIATEAVVRSPRDGYTLLSVGVPNAVNATPNFNFIGDIAPVTGTVRTTYVMVVNPSVPAKTVPEFIAYAKANPGKLSMASSGTGGGPHISGELFKAMTGVDMVHVPYRGDAPALTDLIGGQVQLYFGPAPASIEHIGRDGSLGDDQVRLNRSQCHWFEIAQNVVLQRVDRSVHYMRGPTADAERVAIARGAGDAANSDAAIRAAEVFNNDGLAERDAHSFSQGSCNHICCPTCRK
jgi:hypothetical protein